MAMNIQGQVELPERNLNGAVLTVRLEEVSMMDIPAVTIAQHTEHEVSGGQAVRFKFESAHDPDERARYQVSAHLSLNGDDTVRQGDYVTPQAHPVLTQGHSDQVALTLKAV